MVDDSTSFRVQQPIIHSLYQEKPQNFPKLWLHEPHCRFTRFSNQNTLDFEGKHQHIPRIRLHNLIYSSERFTRGQERKQFQETLLRKPNEPGTLGCTTNWQVTLGRKMKDGQEKRLRKPTMYHTICPTLIKTIGSVSESIDDHRSQSIKRWFIIQRGDYRLVWTVSIAKRWWWANIKREKDEIFLPVLAGHYHFNWQERHWVDSK